MDDNPNYEPFLKALSGADPVQARRFAAAKALEIGWGGASKVSDITGLSRKTINKGIQELENAEKLDQPERLREPGAGRKKAEVKLRRRTPQQAAGHARRRRIKIEPG